jgi:hypothetical protein
MLRRLLVAAALLLPSVSSAQFTHPLPLNSPITVDLGTTPVVTVGPRTEDLSPFLANQFMSFLWWVNIEPAGFRLTLATRARDGLASFVGVFPPSGTSFVNQVPTFTVGSDDLYMWDVIVPGYGRDVSWTITDLNGAVRTATLSTPVPEPSAYAMVAIGLAAIMIARRKRV